MAQPPGCFDNDHPTHVCKLCNAVYGLKKAPCAWYHELRQFLVTSDFTNSHVDTSLFLLNTGRTMIYLLAYVNDIIITGDNDVVIQHFIAFLA